MLQYLERRTAGNLSSLLLCAQTCVDPGDAERIPALCAGSPDWDALLAAAREHGLTPIFCKNVEAHAGAALPPEWRQRFKGEFLRNSCHSLALTAELFRVLNALESRGVNATPYKGPVLAAQAYGDAAMRQFSDLDIIVPQRQIAVADDALAGLGFSPVIPGLVSAESARQIPGQYAYRKGETLVELHTELTLRYFPRGLNLEELCERRQFVNVAGQPILTFSREDTLLLLGVHGSKHLWERLGWIADIAALSQAPQLLDWTIVLDRARRLGIERMVLLGAGLAQRFFYTCLPNEVEHRLNHDAATRHLIAGICERLFAASQVQPGVLSRFAFRVRMRGSLAQGLPYAIRLALMPTELERGPAKVYLEPLYSLLRPLRLVRTYGWRTRSGP